MHILKKILGLFFFTIFWICKVTKIVTWWSMAIGNCLLMNLHNSINRIIWGSFCLKLCLYYIPPAHTYSTHIICVWSCVCRYVCTSSHLCRYIWRPEDYVGVIPHKLCSSFSHLRVSLCVTVSHWPGDHWLVWVYWLQALGIQSLPLQCYKHTIMSNF